MVSRPTHPGLVYVGLEFQRSFSSNTLRGVHHDIECVIPALAAPYATPQPSACNSKSPFQQQSPPSVDGTILATADDNVSTTYRKLNGLVSVPR